MINAELKQPYLETLKHLLNFVELEPESLEKPTRYMPVHYEAGYTGGRLKAYLKAYGIAVSRGVISSKEAHTFFKGRHGEPDKHRFYVRIDQNALLDELENIDSSNPMLATKQLIKAELRLNKRCLYLKVADETYIVKSNLATYRNPYKLLAYLLSQKANHVVPINQVIQAGIDISNMTETLRTAGLNGELKGIFCSVCSETQAQINPIQFVDGRIARALTDKYVSSGVGRS